ncbi:MAG: hypothetical protein AB4352_05005 [Hormoscilla sp.]
MQRQVINLDRENGCYIQSSDEILVLGEQKKSGLIVCKTHYAEFVGPGAAVFSPADTDFVGTIAIGEPVLKRVKTSQARQKAYNIRVQWMRWLQKITESPKNPIKRSEKLLFSLKEFFGPSIVRQLPDEALALLIGVLPRTMHEVRQQQHLAKNQGSGSDWQPLTLRPIATYNLNAPRVGVHLDDDLVQPSRDLVLSLSA